MHTPSFAAYADCLEREDEQGIADLMLASAEKLAAIGADFLICPDNTIHLAFSRVEPKSPLPWLHIAEVVANEALARDYRLLGITGTKWLIESSVYPDALRKRGLEFLRPRDEERDEISRIIMEELVNGEFLPDSIIYLKSVIAGMGEAGCDAVVLGCTELPLVLNDANSPLPVLDSTRLLARAALHRAVGDKKVGTN